MLFCLDVILLLHLLRFLFLVVVVYEGQVTLRLHTLIDDDSKVFLIFIFEDIDFLPGIILDSLSLLLMILDHVLNVVFETSGLLNLSVELDLLILSEFLNDLLVVKTELIKTLFKFSCVLIFLSLQFVESLLIGVHLISVILASTLLLDLMTLLNLAHLFFVHSVSVLFGLKELLIESFVFFFLVFDFLLDLVDLLLFALKL